MGKIAEFLKAVRPVKEELSQEVQDKIKANNDKMTALKAKGGEEAEKEIDDLEKENDELNGGNKTATAESLKK